MNDIRDAELYWSAKECTDKKHRNVLLNQLSSEFPDSDYIGYALEMKMSDEMRSKLSEMVLNRPYNNEQILFVMWHGDKKNSEIAKKRHEEHWESRKHEFENYLRPSLQHAV